MINSLFAQRHWHRLGWPRWWRSSRIYGCWQPSTFSRVQVPGTCLQQVWMEYPFYPIPYCHDTFIRCKQGWILWCLAETPGQGGYKPGKDSRHFLTRDGQGISRVYELPYRMQRKLNSLMNVKRSLWSWGLRIQESLTSSVSSLKEGSLLLPMLIM